MKVFQQRRSAAFKILVAITIAYRLRTTACYVCGRLLPEVEHRSSAAEGDVTRIECTSTCGNDQCRYTECEGTQFVDLYSESHHPGLWCHSDLVLQCAAAALSSGKEEHFLHPIPASYLDDDQTHRTVYARLRADVTFLHEHCRAMQLQRMSSNAEIRMFFIRLACRQARVPEAVVAQAMHNMRSDRCDLLSGTPFKRGSKELHASTAGCHSGLRSFAGREQCATCISLRHFLNDRSGSAPCWRQQCSWRIVGASNRPGKHSNRQALHLGVVACQVYPVPLGDIACRCNSSAGQE